MTSDRWMLLGAVGTVFEWAAGCAAFNWYLHRERQRLRNARREPPIGSGDAQWDRIVGRLHKAPNDVLGRLALECDRYGRPLMTPEECWEGVGGARGLRQVARSAGVLVELARHADKHWNVAPGEVDEIRSLAYEARMACAEALAERMRSQSLEGPAVRAVEALTRYQALADRMLALHRHHSPARLAWLQAAL